MAQGRTRIVIAGGGSAGWMAAAALRRFLGPDHAVCLIESEAVGTVGVGEATIPQLRLFNAALGIDEDEFMRACGGSFKLGIQFDGWRKPGEVYLHAFGNVGRDVGLTGFQHLWLRARSLELAGELGDYCLNAVAADAGRMHRGAALTAKAIPPLPYAFHFDAALYAAFLRRRAETGGVVRHEGRILSVERDGESGEVRALLLEGDRRIEGDFFVDCTGFRALLIGDALGVGYRDWRRWLPCDRAVAAPSAAMPPLPPYTRATAHEAGWQWRIPLQHRTGNGLVYCSDYLDDDAAEAMLVDLIGGSPSAPPRRLRFVTGMRERGWCHNVVAMGLSSGFLEPLESTSIHLIQTAISRLLQLFPRAGGDSAALRREYNRQLDFEMARIRDFLILHYWANERSEPFWVDRRAAGLPDSLAERIALWRDSAVIVREHEELFTEAGWIQVLIGQGVIPHSWHPLADTISAEELSEYLVTLNTLYRREVARYADHDATIAAGSAMR
ncbi:tryptophan halogenase family protein [Sphingomonas sp. IW22]|uniref:tryptophan halogenase family protein n=1 Tax=Sphingomonas sp. IW22 TaxID=3242489 RepID=UPI003521350E